ncbi:MAG: 30S ribosomal protein S1 [Campylobacterales bacterium]
MDKEALENIDIDDETEDFATLLEESLKSEGAGSEQLLQGVIVKITDDGVMVDVGMKQEGRLDISEIKDEQGNLLFKVGESLPVVLSSKPGERPRISHKKAIKKQKVAEFIEANKNRSEEEPLDITGIVTRKNAGGYLVEADGIEFFMPVSLAAFKPEMKPVGKSVTARVVKMDEKTGTLVLSRRAWLNGQRKQRREAIKKIVDAGDVMEATVKRIKSYGMFVEAMGAEGLVHYTEISYKGPVNPANLYKEGDVVPVKVIEFDKEKNRISFSIKATQFNPWEEIAEQLEAGDTIKVTVANMENYGAFVDLGNDIEGFLHISEISWDKDLKHPSEVLTLGQEIEVEVIELDVPKQRLRVSLKKLQPKPFERFAQKHRVGETLKGTVTSLKEFGAFVKVDGVEGLLHNEDCSWNRNESAKDLFKAGDEIEVSIIKIDQENGRLSLSRKSLSESPIEQYAKSHGVGDIVHGTVRDVKDFGVFVNLENDVDALIRAEDLAPLKAEEIKAGDAIEAAIVAMEPKKGRIRLSVRRLEKQKERDVLKSINSDDRMTLGDALKGSLKND